MSAEMLRKAARVAREEWRHETTGPFKGAARIHLAVADWLEIEANEGCWLFQVTPEPDSQMGRALAVARAYLGESAP